jgi:hypothetical protein
MKQTELEKKLLAAARRNSPSDHVPYAFEKRVMAFIRSHPMPDGLSEWARALWRSAGACLAVLVLSAGLSLVPNETAPAGTGDLSLDFEKTMMAALDSDYSR